MDRFQFRIVVAHYRLRGFTPDITGKKPYIGHTITSIHAFLT